MDVSPTPTQRHAKKSVNRGLAKPLGPIEFGNEFLGRNATVGIFQDRAEIAVTHFSVEAHAEPSSPAHVGRAKEAFGVGIDEGCLGAWRCGTPDAQNPVTVVIIHEHRDGFLAPHKKRRRAMAEPLGDFGEAQALFADSRKLFVVCFGAHRP